MGLGLRLAELTELRGQVESYLDLFLFGIDSFYGMMI
jgi:hypothetical protein